MSAETFLDGKVTLHGGDCLGVLDTLAENSLDACVTDPPYHFASIVKRFGAEAAAPAKDYSGERLNATGAFARASRGFMGKQWDGGDIAFRAETWAKVLRVLKPGAHLLAFCAPKNFGHLQVAIEAAGFETRDCILDLIDLDPLLAAFVGSLNDAQRAALLRLIDEGTTGALLAWIFGSGFPKSHNISKAIDRARTMDYAVTAPATAAAAAAWAGYGTALKPAFEPIILARKPLDGTVAENCLKWGTGALNIDGGRVGVAAGTRKKNPVKLESVTCYGDGLNGGGSVPIDAGRWPADVILDDSQAVADAFPEVGGAGVARELKQSSKPARCDGYGMDKNAAPPAGMSFADQGSAARFFYTAKADGDDRLGSKHPTVKPLDLMQYLVRLVTRPGQTVLDLFAGTGTTGEAAFREGRRAVLIEREEEYRADIRRRMALVMAGPDERAIAAIKASGRAEDAALLPLFGAQQTLFAAE